MTTLHRRTLLTAAAVSLGAGLVQSERAGAAVPLAGKQAPGFYRFKLGAYEVTILHDGARLAAGALAMRDIPPGETWCGVPARPIRRWRKGSCAPACRSRGGRGISA